MTHEWHHIWQHYIKHRHTTRFVLASVVYLEGSSYRRPGVRMLIGKDGQRIGAVSGGCVEKEVERQCESVFKDGKPRMMQYDGRYRLGCEGVLHLLLEPFDPPENSYEKLNSCFSKRQSFGLKSYFSRKLQAVDDLGTFWQLEGVEYPLSQTARQGNSGLFEERLLPRPRLLVFGGEHDAVILTRMAKNLGYEIGVFTDPKEGKLAADFPGADAHEHWVSGQSLAGSTWRPDPQTAVVVMSHNFARDLAFLGVLGEEQFSYLGILGPAHRREKLGSALFDHFPDIPIAFLERWNAPAGLDLGGENAAEIALSILAEILKQNRGHSGLSLKEKAGRIHEEG
jgi:xanthine/CO dehydrogenase XdhC/CoxF family maturation factor